MLYCSETEKTALAEIRPGRGYICTTCKLLSNREMRVVDLASALTMPNPFAVADLSWQLDLRRIARNLSVEIAKPTTRGEDSVVYSKSQCFAMIVRAMKLDGVRFGSSLDTPNGVNLALFDATAVDFSASSRDCDTYGDKISAHRTPASCREPIVRRPCQSAVQVMNRNA